MKKHRLAAGLTQEELAEKAQVSTRTISDVERGLRTRIYRDTADRLADALDLDGTDRDSFVTASRVRPAEIPPGPRIPRPLTPLVGRSWEIASVVNMLGARSLRLVTLTGPGGVGKTRLALEAALRVDPEATFVDLGDLNDARLVVPSIAGAVGVPGRAEPSVESIVEHLGDEHRLLVLDTFEHVLPAAPDVGRLLASAPAIMILVTSREALRVRGEHEIVVPALDLGATGSAVELFTERALTAQPSLAIDAEVAADICHRLSGLPLAIELAAARAKHLPLPRLRDELRNSLQVLTQGARDLPPRQRTMRDTVRWSYELLDPDLQEIFRDLCVCAGGWTLDEAAIVITSDALEGCSVLVDKSLVAREDQRYSMLDVIREFGLELGSRSGALDRHLGAFITLAERAEPEIGGAEQNEWIERLVGEQGNIRAALTYAISKRDGERAMRLSASIWRFWMVHGDLSEGRSWLREALALDVPARLRSKGLWGLGWLAYHQGDYEEAESCANTMLEIATDDVVEVRNAFTMLGIVQMAKGDPNAAIPTFERCVELLSQRDPDWLSATSLLNLGMAMLHSSDPRAAQVLMAARDLYEKIGDAHFVARVILYGGYDSLLRGDTDAALRSARGATMTFWELNDRGGTAEGLELSASVAAVNGRAERAATLAAAAGSLRATITSAPFPLDAAILARFLEEIRPSAGDGKWESWMVRGHEIPIEDAVSIATTE
jgi:predicted ATPase/DNA-binding XRE family transcriptional regulator